jgi:hypothetical protein
MAELPKDETLVDSAFLLQTLFCEPWEGGTSHEENNLFVLVYASIITGGMGQ